MSDDLNPDSPQPEQAPLTEDSSDNDGVLVHPAILFGAVIVAGGIIDYLISEGSFGETGWFRWLIRMLGYVGTVSGFLIAAAALFQMFQAKTDPRPDKPTTAVIKDGIFTFSRNPLYLAAILFTVGLSFLVDAPAILLFMLPMLIVLRLGVIAREEQYLEGKFGTEYTEYRDSVGRWVGPF